jgi:hypothetical protein
MLHIRHFYNITIIISISILLIYVFYSTPILIERLLFPYDYFFWAESPFMTNMVKLENGESLFSPLSDANSFIYTGVTERLSFLVLKLFDLEVDIRVFRVISVAFSVVASFFLGASMSIILDGLELGPRKTTLSEFALFTMASFFLISRNFTSDIPHPDNLHILYLSILLFLTLKSVQKRSLILGGLAAFLGGFGFLAKQTGLLACGAPIVALGWIFRGRPLFVLGFFVIGAATTTLLLSWYLFDENVWLWAFEVPMNQPIVFLKIVYIIGAFAAWPDVGVVLIWLIALLILYVRARRHRQSSIPFPIFLSWLMVGVFLALPNLASIMKIRGSWNNLAIIEVWMAVLALPVLASEIRERRPSRRDHDRGGKSRPIKIGALATHSLVILGLGCFLASLMPTKRAPNDRHFKFGETLTSMIRNDVQQGKSVLLSHGTMPLLLAGLDTVPVDRAISILELETAGIESSAGTAQRIKDQVYDRIYLVKDDWYGREIHDLLDTYYKPAGEIPGAPALEGYRAGFQVLLQGPAAILEPRK